jgi:dTDP-4-dehydrorhamnose reductase
MLGVDVVDVLRSAGHDVVALSRSDLDIRDAASCRQAVEGVDVVVNCAAWTDVDGAESHESEAFVVNAVGAVNVARAARLHDAVMVHVSTDYVFSGDAHEPYPVDAPLAPVNAYGRTKAAGEWGVRAECPRSHIVRSAWLYGEHGPNFVATMLRLAKAEGVVDVVDDQRGQPTWTRDLSSYILDLAVSSRPPGIHHATGSGECTWYELARAAFAAAGHDPGRIRPTSSRHQKRKAPRPAYSVLANDGPLPYWHDSLRRVVPLLGP